MNKQGPSSHLHRGLAVLILVLGALASFAGNASLLPAIWTRPVGDLGIALLAAAVYAVTESLMHLDLPTIISSRISRTSDEISREIVLMKYISDRRYKSTC